MTRQETIEVLKGIVEEASESKEAVCYVSADEDIDALNMAIKALEQEPIIRCEECKHHGTSNCPMWGDDTTEDYMWCCDGERMESDEE